MDICAPYDKMNKLQDYLRSKPRGFKTIIFCGTKRMCDQVCQSLARDFGAASIHGDKRQQERDWVLRSFKESRVNVLVATDVAARGLDIRDVEAVINFDFPQGVEDYIHRIGRTGRAGQKGESFTLLTQEDSKYARELVGVMRDALQVCAQTQQSGSYSLALRTVTQACAACEAREYCPPLVLAHCRTG